VPALPKAIGECRDIPLCGFMSDSAGDVLGPGLLVLALREQVSLIGVLKRLPGMFMSGQVIFFSVALGAGPMDMGSKVMILSGDLLRFVHKHCGCTRGSVVAPGQRRAQHGTPTCLSPVRTARFTERHRLFRHGGPRHNQCEVVLHSLLV
jgi:hypothetical protein